MNKTFVIKKEYWTIFDKIRQVLTPGQWVMVIATCVAIGATIYSFIHGTIVSYGDAESHLNIAKRVVDGVTPGFAQLGGIWLPLPHLLLIPFVYFDFLWRTGLAGSIVSGIAFVLSAKYIYRLSLLLTKDVSASFFASIVFISNPNILYLQSTPMTELTLIVFFVLSSYYFIRFLMSDSEILLLLLAAFFGFCASLSRYDGWALVLMEAGVLFLFYLPLTFKTNRFKSSVTFFKSILKSGLAFSKERWSLMEGRVVLFSTLAFFGVLLWFMWGWLILGDPLYFTHSQFSASSQQHGWLEKGELPAAHHPLISLLYYFMTAVETMGVLIALPALAGIIAYTYSSTKLQHHRFFVLLVLLVPFFFNVLTLYLGQSVIFLPGITPYTFEWTLFNVRYGTMMVPAFAVFAGFLFYNYKIAGRLFLIGLLVVQWMLFGMGYSQVLSYDDGVAGLSSQTAKTPDAQKWLEKNYDYGMLLTDDFARTISIIRTKVPMNQLIYIGNKPYWEDSLVEPEKYARWIVIQKDDALWKAIYDDPLINGRLFKYFNKVYTSDTILIFRRIDDQQQ